MPDSSAAPAVAEAARAFFFGIAYLGSLELWVLRRSALLLVAFTALQLLGFPLHAGAPMPWATTHDAVQPLAFALNVVSATRLDATQSPAVFRTLFGVALAWTLLVGAVAATVGATNRRWQQLQSHEHLRSSESLAVRALRLGGLLSSTVLFLPVVSLLLRGLTCPDLHADGWMDAGFACASAERIVLAVFAFLCLLLFLAFNLLVVLTFVDRDPCSSSWLAQIHGRVDAALLLVKLLLAFLFNVVDAQLLGTPFLAVLLLLAGAAWFSFNFLVAPFAHPHMQALGAACASLFLVASVALFFAILLPDYDVTLVLYLGGILAFVLGGALALHWETKVASRPLDELRDLTHIFLWARSRLRAYAELRLDSSAHHSRVAVAATTGPAKESGGTDSAARTVRRTVQRDGADLDDSAGLLADAETAYRFAMDTFPRSELAFIVGSAFFRFHTPLHFQEALSLSRARTYSPGLDSAYYIAQRTRQLRDLDTPGLSSADRLSFERNMRDVQKLRVEAHRHLVLVWDTLSHREPDLSQLLSVGLEFQNTLQAIDKVYQALMRSNTESISVLRSYASFLLDLANEPVTAAELLTRADRIEEMHSKQRSRSLRHIVFGAEMPMQDAMDERSAVVTMSGDLATMGEILTVTGAVCRLFGYTASQLVGQNIAILIPQPIRGAHDSILHRFASAATTPKVTNHSLLVFGQAKAGHIFPMLLRVVEAPPQEETCAPRFTGVMQPIATDENHILFGPMESGFRIYAASQRSLMLLGIEAESVAEENVSLLQWFPTLMPTFTSDYVPLSSAEAQRLHSMPSMADALAEWMGEGGGARRSMSARRWESRGGGGGGGDDSSAAGSVGGRAGYGDDAATSESRSPCAFASRSTKRNTGGAKAGSDGDSDVSDVRSPKAVFTTVATRPQVEHLAIRPQHVRVGPLLQAKKSSLIPVTGAADDTEVIVGSVQALAFYNTGSFYLLRWRSLAFEHAASTTATASAATSSPPSSHAVGANGSARVSQQRHTSGSQPEDSTPSDEHTPDGILSSKSRRSRRHRRREHRHRSRHRSKSPSPSASSSPSRRGTESASSILSEDDDDDAHLLAMVGEEEDEDEDEGEDERDEDVTADTVGSPASRKYAFVSGFTTDPTQLQQQPQRCPAAREHRHAGFLSPGAHGASTAVLQPPRVEPSALSSKPSRRGEDACSDGRAQGSSEKRHHRRRENSRHKGTIVVDDDELQHTHWSKTGAAGGGLGGIEEVSEVDGDASEDRHHGGIDGDGDEGDGVREFSSTQLKAAGAFTGASSSTRTDPRAQTLPSAAPRRLSSLGGAMSLGSPMHPTFAPSRPLRPPPVLTVRSREDRSEELNDRDRDHELDHEGRAGGHHGSSVKSSSTKLGTQLRRSIIAQSAGTEREVQWSRLVLLGVFGVLIVLLVTVALWSASLTSLVQEDADTLFSAGRRLTAFQGAMIKVRMLLIEREEGIEVANLTDVHVSFAEDAATFHDAHELVSTNEAASGRVARDFELNHRLAVTEVTMTPQLMNESYRIGLGVGAGVPNQSYAMPLAELGTQMAAILRHLVHTPVQDLARIDRDVANFLTNRQVMRDAMNVSVQLRLREYVGRFPELQNTLLIVGAVFFLLLVLVSGALFVTIVRSLGDRARSVLLLFLAVPQSLARAMRTRSSVLLKRAIETDIDSDSDGGGDGDGGAGTGGVEADDEHVALLTNSHPTGRRPSLTSDDNASGAAGARDAEGALDDGRFHALVQSVARQQQLGHQVSRPFQDNSRFVCLSVGKLLLPIGALTIWIAVLMVFMIDTNAMARNDAETLERLQEAHSLLVDYVDTAWRVLDAVDPADRRVLVTQMREGDRQILERTKLALFGGAITSASGDAVTLPSLPSDSQAHRLLLVDGCEGSLRDDCAVVEDGVMSHGLYSAIVLFLSIGREAIARLPDPDPGGQLHAGELLTTLVRMLRLGFPHVDEGLRRVTRSLKEDEMREFDEGIALVITFSVAFIISFIVLSPLFYLPILSSLAAPLHSARNLLTVLPDDFVVNLPELRRLLQEVVVEAKFGQRTAAHTHAPSSPATGSSRAVSTASTLHCCPALAALERQAPATGLATSAATAAAVTSPPPGHSSRALAGPRSEPISTADGRVHTGETVVVNIMDSQAPLSTAGRDRS